MNVNFFFRYPGNFSIEHVFDTIARGLQKQGVRVFSYYMPCKGTLPWVLFRNIYFTFKNRGTINHITGDVYYIIGGLNPSNTILTIHDIGRFVNHMHDLKRVRLMALLWYNLPLRRAKYVTTISEFTKQQILKYYPWAEKKIRVIHNPVDPRIQKSIKSFNKIKPVILQIGTGENKNLERTIESLANIPCHFRVIGNLTSNQKELIRHYRIDYSSVSNLTDDEIFEEYKKCDIVSFPSWYEGFGMPVIEGQKVGRIVLTSNIEPLIEVSGYGAVLVNPYNVASIREGFLKIIEDDSFRESVLQKGFKNVEKYDYIQIAAEYNNLYKEILNNH